MFIANVQVKGTHGGKNGEHGFVVLLLIRPPGNTVNQKNKSNVKVAGSWWGRPHIVQLYVCQSVMLIGFIYCCWFHGMIDEGVSVSYCCQTTEI